MAEAATVRLDPDLDMSEPLDAAAARALLGLIFGGGADDDDDAAGRVG